MTSSAVPAQLAVVRADVTAHGFTTGIYSGIYYWPTYMGNTTRFSTDPFWLADVFSLRDKSLNGRYKLLEDGNAEVTASTPTSRLPSARLPAALIASGAMAPW